MEKSRGDGEASSAAARLLVPLHVAEQQLTPFFALYLVSTKMLPAFVPELQHETVVNVEYRASGVLRVSLSDEEESLKFSEFQNWERAFGLEIAWLD